jgi:hypothetical protein
MDVVFVGSFKANKKLILEIDWLKEISRGMLLAPAGPGSISTFPVSVEKKVGATSNPPGSAGELKVAVIPLFVSANGVATPTVGKLNVAVVAAAGEAKAKRAATVAAARPEGAGDLYIVSLLIFSQALVATLGYA